MLPELALIGACGIIAILIALPTLEAGQRRRTSREWSAVAAALGDFAAAVRREKKCLPLEESLLTRARRLAIPELVSFEYLQALTAPDHVLIADSAQRLALRLKRRVAFERKMLARTAAGRWRGAIAAATPAIILLALAAGGVTLPSTALLWLLVIETLGCWLLWRAARIEV